MNSKQFSDVAFNGPSMFRVSVHIYDSIWVS